MSNRLFSLFSKGSAVIFTAGLVGATASLPSVVKNVDPGCLPVADQVRSMVTDRDRRGTEKYKDDEGLWKEGMELNDEDMSQRHWKYPCYGFFNTYGGLVGNWEEEATDGKGVSTEDSKAKGVGVIRECSRGAWEKILKTIKEQYEKLKKEKGNETENKWKKAIEQILKSLEKLSETSKGKDIIEVGKEIKKLWHSENYDSLLKIFKSMDDWAGRKDESFQKLHREIERELEFKITKIIEINNGGAVKGRLQQIPSYCLAI